jgi:hypothetical protein
VDWVRGRELSLPSRAAPGAVSLINSVQALRATLRHGRLALLGADGLRFGFSSLTVGRRGSLTPVSLLGAASLRRNEVVLSSSSAVSEWFANGPWGVEQGFTLAHRPAGNGTLLITQTLSGNTTGRVTPGGQSVIFSSTSGVLRYEDLVVTDAAGTRVPARFAVSAARLTITVADAHAVYPLRTVRSCSSSSSRAQAPSSCSAPTRT